MATAITQPEASLPSTPSVEESKPAPVSSRHTEDIRIPRPFTPEYAKWRLSNGKDIGEVAKPEPQAKAEAEEEKTTEKPDSEPGNGPKRKGGAAERLESLLADLREAGLTPAELKNFKSQYRKAGAEPDTKPAAQPAEPAQQQKPAAVAQRGPEPPKRPVMADFTGKPWSDWEEANAKYFEDLADYKAAVALDRYRQEQQAAARRDADNRQLDEAAARYGDHAKAQIVDAASRIGNHPGVDTTVKALISASPVVADLLYAIGEKGIDDIVRLGVEDPAEAIRQIVLTESMVKEKLAGKTGTPTAAVVRDEKGQFVSEAKKSAAPPPARDIGATRAIPEDPSDAAFRAGDFAKFRAEENRKYLQRLRG
jgi:hypothetical protein